MSCQFYSVVVLCSTAAASIVPTKVGWAAQDDTSLIQSIIKKSSDVRRNRDQKDSRKRHGNLDGCLDQYADGLDSLQPGFGHAIRAHPRTVMATSSREMFFGAAPGRTATRSLQVALQMMAIQFNETWKVSHEYTTTPENEAYVCALYDALNKTAPMCLPRLHNFDYTDISETVGSMVGEPVYALFIDFFLAFPAARWILLPRPSDEWAASYLDRFGDHGVYCYWPMQEPCGTEPGTLGVHMLANMYDLTHDFIKCAVPPEQLLVIDVFTQSTEGTMQQLREFLGYPANSAVDTAEFPHTDQLMESGLIEGCGQITWRPKN